MDETGIIRHQVADQVHFLPDVVAPLDAILLVADIDGGRDFKLVAFERLHTTWGAIFYHKLNGIKCFDNPLPLGTWDLQFFEKEGNYTINVVPIRKIVRGRESRLTCCR